MKKTFLHLAAATIILSGLASCGGDSPDRNDDSVDSTEKLNEQVAENNATPLSENDAEFAVTAANAGMTEIELAKLALSKSANTEVKNYAQMMIDDHTAAHNKLISLAANKNISLPASISDENKKHIEDMGKENGAKFDKKYISMMADDHDDLLEEFRKENERTQDVDIKSFTTETIPVLTKHHDQAKALKDKMK